MELRKTILEQASRTYFMKDHENVPKNIPDHLKKESPRFWVAHHFDVSRQLAASANVHPDHKEDLKRYTKHHPTKDEPLSRSLNKKLVSGKELNGKDSDMHKAIVSSVHKSPMDVHLYSGTKIDFGHLAKQSKDGILHNLAHLSATHSPERALNYAMEDKRPSKTEPYHVLHIHVKKKDPIVHVSHVSEFRDEHETVLPAGSKLKYSHSTEHNTDGGWPVHVHHFSIHKE